MNTDDLDDHPDLQDLRLSRKDERKAMAEARRRQRQALAMPAEPSFLRRNRALLVVLGVLAALIAASVVLSDRARSGASETAPPAVHTFTAEAPAVDLSQPFAGTPAASWADGAAGIAPPAAAPVGTYSAEQVSAGYARVRQLLVSARLDPAVLEGHDFERVLTQLAPAARTQVDMSRPSTEAYVTATRVADGFHLLPVPPKVTGSMSATVSQEGALLVHTNYLFAYAFDPAGQPRITDPMRMIAVDRFESDYTITDTRWTQEDQGIWQTSVKAYSYSVACGALKRGELAPSYSEPLPPGTPAADEKQAFNPTAPIPTTSNCP